MNSTMSISFDNFDFSFCNDFLECFENEESIDSFEFHKIIFTPLRFGRSCKLNQSRIELGSVKYDILKKLIHLYELPSDWNGYGAKQITQKVLEDAVFLSDFLVNYNDVNLVIGAMNDGGILFTLKNNDATMLISIEKDYVDSYFSTSKEKHFTKFSNLDRETLAFKICNEINRFVRK